MGNHKKNVLLAASLMLIASVAPIFAAEATVAPSAQATQNLPAIRVVKVAQRLLTDRTIVTGSIEAVEEVYVQPQVDGLRIETLAADVGDVVKKGAVLATLSDDALLLQKSQLDANHAKVLAVGAQLNAQLMEAKVNAADAEKQAVRAEILSKSGAVASSQSEQLRATAAAAAARVNSARQAIMANVADVNVVDAQIRDIDLKLARTDIKAPVDGVISARTARIGAIAAGAGQPLFTLIRDNAVELKADVAEGDLLKLKPGQIVHISVAGTNTGVSGKVRTIEPTIDATTRLGTVRITVDDPAMARVGMYASAEVIISARNVLSAPLTAVTSEKDGIFVRKIVGNEVKTQKVETGVQDGDYVEIMSGLSENDVVVEKAGAYVRDGDRIVPVFSDKTATN
jgi:HlyD family secretion protein